MKNDMVLKCKLSKGKYHNRVTVEIECVNNIQYIIDLSYRYCWDMNNNSLRLGSLGKKRIDGKVAVTFIDVMIMNGKKVMKVELPKSIGSNEIIVDNKLISNRVGKMICEHFNDDIFRTFIVEDN